MTLRLREPAEQNLFRFVAKLYSAALLLAVTFAPGAKAESAIVLWKDGMPRYHSVPINVHFAQNNPSDKYLQFANSEIAVINALFDRDLLILKSDVLTSLQQLQHRDPIIAIGIAVGHKYVPAYDQPQNALIQATIFGVEAVRARQANETPVGTTVDVITKSFSFDGRDKSELGCAIGLFYIDRTVGHAQIKIPTEITDDEPRMCFFVGIMFSIGIDPRRLPFDRIILKDVLRAPALVNWDPRPTLLPTTTRRMIADLIP